MLQREPRGSGDLFGGAGHLEHARAVHQAGDRTTPREQPRETGAIRRRSCRASLQIDPPSALVAREDKLERRVAELPREHVAQPTWARRGTELDDQTCERG